MKHVTEYDPPSLTIGDITARLPIIQGGMGIGVSMSGLASAVARSGGIGVLAAVLIGLTEPDFKKNPRKATFNALEKQIKKAKEQAPGGIIGVNIMVALTDYDRLIGIAARAGVDLIISGAGLPLKLPKLVPEGTNPKLVPIVSSGRAARIICRRWTEHFSRVPDAVVVEGPKAGGHLGFKAQELDSPQNAIEALIPEVRKAVRPFEDRSGKPIPVIAAGGIYTGEDIFRFIQMGAAGVQMGTRFVATHECDASDEFKQAYLNARKEDVIIIKSPVGMPGRALKGPVTIKATGDELNPPNRCSYHCLRPCNYKNTPYCISSALIKAQRGQMDSGLVFCGSNVWRVNKIVHVQELVDELVKGYRQAARKAREETTRG